MKKQISIASALVAASGFSHGEIKINEYLSFEGFVAADYAVADSTIGDVDESDNFFGVPEVEIDWLFNFGAVGGRIDLQHEDQWNDDIVEQAFMTYKLWDEATLTAGRYASMLGYEDFERPGLHQYSYAYDLQLTQFGAPGQSDAWVGISPGYNQGLKFTYESNGNFFGVSVQDSVFNFENDRFGGDANPIDIDGDGVTDFFDDPGSYGIEVAGALQLAEGLRWFMGGAYEDVDVAEADKNYMLNTYLAYEAGPWTFGAELNYGESESGAFALGGLVNGITGLFPALLEESVLQGMIVANYAYNDCSSITGRISYSEHDGDLIGGGNIDADGIKYTLAHKYAFSENLALINEVSYVDGDVGNAAGSVDFDSVVGAASLLFTF
jgi:hypothetical protein